ncbi:hypothetical protein LRP49_11845 [Enterovibrio sp. ZSDZ35]|uniref:Caa(3)-type oxidase, subunit IV n=1 Tax=Enterovibrio qingdaonensis TaxID=2899818 RepID=A0ABT5QLK6_9GAMM|nr:hypothetical protein [Enterovibrio sp. ZSDZ35]MDD1781867.1 hypothetical protein [Enterovibrio sp. ZSDZ35]
MSRSESTTQTDLIKKAFLWLVVVDYLLLGMFLFLLPTLTLSGGTAISTLLMLYNLLLSVLCFQRVAHQHSHIIYPTLSATLLAFIFFLYFFFLV